MFIEGCRRFLQLNSSLGVGQLDFIPSIYILICCQVKFANLQNSKSQVVFKWKDVADQLMWPFHFRWEETAPGRRTESRPLTPTGVCSTALCFASLPMDGSSAYSRSIFTLSLPIPTLNIIHEFRC